MSHGKVLLASRRGHGMPKLQLNEGTGSYSFSDPQTCWSRPPCSIAWLRLVLDVIERCPRLQALASIYRCRYGKQASSDSSSFRTPNLVKAYACELLSHPSTCAKQGMWTPLRLSTEEMRKNKTAETEKVVCFQWRYTTWTPNLVKSSLCFSSFSVLFSSFSNFLNYFGV